MSPGPATNSVPSSMRIASRPLTWYWKCGASQLSVPRDRLDVVRPAPAGLEDEPADLAAADLEDLGAAVGELARLVGLVEALVLGLVPVRHPWSSSSWTAGPTLTY